VENQTLEKSITVVYVNKEDREVTEISGVGHVGITVEDFEQEGAALKFATGIVGNFTPIALLHALIKLMDETIDTLIKDMELPPHIIQGALDSAIKMSLLKHGKAKLKEMGHPASELIEQIETLMNKLLEDE